MIEHSFGVTGLTCAHCVSAVTDELTALPGVGAISVRLVADGISTVTVTSSRPIEATAVSAALDEAGNYQLA
ncbi:MAG: heavy-metal-associated domain-containing protein [Jatrophihabitantaceae bacterium]